MSETKDYKSTLNLPETSFPMKGNLPEREPIQLQKWEAEKIYEKVLEGNKGNTPYVLHDGPPYANGNIHMGTALNKILKDIVVRYKNMSGFLSPYVPGWDCHGLPIELQVEKKFGKTTDAGLIISRCREYAKEFIDKQRETFKRLGVYGEWDKPYLTMNKDYEAQIIKEFAKIVETGAVYRADKPVYWCANCVTALAEAEVEYADHRSSSIFVKFKAGNDLKKALDLDKESSDIFVVIWTTTPWTLPANLAISLNPEYEYGAYKNKTSNEVWVIATELFEKFIKDVGENTDNFTQLTTKKGSVFENFECQHPFLEQKSKLILGEHVTLESGTGCVHTAPGHGVDDYIVGKKYGLVPYNPVDDHGVFYKDIPLVGGIKTKEANAIVINNLKESGALIFTSTVAHSYPHCWRCKSPIIFRATPQWFISMEKTELRKKALQEIEKVKWTPDKGMKRIYSMVENRPDWCVSRQRIWGVPIVSFQCAECGETILDTKIINKVAEMVSEHGIEVWHSKDVKDFLPKGTKCSKCSSENLKKGRDILDVWFDSGISHAAVCEKDKRLGSPADLYLEGSDQHRGWFHTSLLESVITRGRAPYKQVVTHGFIVDKKGYKMSKSLGNVVDPMDLIKKSGSDILRLWVSYENFAEDISYSEESYVRVTDAYRRVRNTYKFILGNVFDFDPAKNTVAYKDLREIDKWMIHELNKFTQEVLAAYDNFEFYKIYHLIHNFCVVELSSLYLDVSKDILYVNKKDSYERRCIQTVMHDVLDNILKLLAPILPFTTEEAWQCLPYKKEASIHLSKMPKVNKSNMDEALEEKWAKILELREEVSKVLEKKRQDKIIGHSLDAEVILTLPDELYKLTQDNNIDLVSLFIVSNIKASKGAELSVEVNKSSFNKCARCWQYRKEVGTIKEHEELCERCKNAIS
ncbi:MAG: isoleucine--tRNA ligase [bacterium]